MSAVCVDLGLPFAHPEFRPRWPANAHLSRPCADCGKLLKVELRRAPLVAWMEAGMPLENLEDWFTRRTYVDEEDLSPFQRRPKPLTRAQFQALHAMVMGGEALCGGCAQRRRLAERDLAKAMTVGI